MTQQIIVVNRPHLKDAHMQLSMTHIRPIYVMDTDLERDIGSLIQLAVFNIDQEIMNDTDAV
jgi:hypothetical protein